MMQHGTDLLLIIWNIIIYAIWLISLDKLGGTFFQKKDNAIVKYICILTLLVITNILTASNYLVGSIAQQTFLILFFFINFQGDKWEKLGFSSVLVSIWKFILNGTGSTLSICNIILSNNKFVPYERGNEYFITILSALTTVVCMYLLFCRTKLAEGNFLHGGGKILCSISWLLLLMIDICGFGITRGIVMVSNGSGAKYWNTTYNEILTHLEVLVLSVLCMTICLALLFGMNRLIGYVIADNLHKMEIRRYKGILEQYKKQADVRHDLKNHLISLSALAEHEEWDKLRDYLLKLYNAGMIDEEDIETGNNVVNAIINTKKQVAKQKNIRFDCNVNITEPLMIDEYDLCIIWGNILDNAIKAADVSGERYVLVQAEIVKKNLVINVKNSAALDIQQKEFNKQNWGIGLKNVNKIVLKENGIMEIELKGSVFDISIMLPIVKCHPCRI